MREKQMDPLPEPQAPVAGSWPDLPRLLDEELTKLSDKYRVPIILCDLEGKSQREAATYIGLPEGTLSSRLSRGRSALAKRLARRGLTLSAGGLSTTLAQQAVSATVPRAVVLATLDAASVFVGRQAAAAPASGFVVSLANGVLKGMLFTKLGSLTALVFVGACLSMGFWAQVPGAKTAKVESRAQSFDDLSPAARFQAVRGTSDSDKRFHTADRGEVASSLKVRGNLASANDIDIRWQTTGQRNVATIKWIVGDGARVKKGDVLVSLDSSYFEKLLKAKAKAHEITCTAIAAAEAAVDQGQLQIELREVDGQIGVHASELKLKRFSSNDADEKELLRLQVNRARIARQLSAVEGKSRLMAAKADLLTKKASADQETAELDEIKEQIGRYTIKAPKDGVVYHHVGFGPGTLATGKTVESGQSLLEMPDLDNIDASIRVHEALVASLRGEGKDRSQWQQASIKVDAYPDLTFNGHVKFVNTMPTQSGDDRVYTTLVAIDKEERSPMPRLRPGLSAEVTVQGLARKAGVVRVPITAVVQVGPSHYCYAKSGQEILKREVVLGLRGDGFVEVKSGIQEKDVVVRDAGNLTKPLPR
jgi:RND family efflux transporter MFP subunit